MDTFLRPPGSHQIRDRVPDSVASFHSGHLGSETGFRSRNLDGAAGDRLLTVRRAEIICGKEIKAWTPLISHPHRGPSAKTPIIQ